MTNAEAAERLRNIATAMSLIGDSENAIAAITGANILSNPIPETIRGYRIAELEVLAELLREQDVSPITVTRLCKDATYLYRLTNEQVVKDIREAKRHLKLSDWKGENNAENNLCTVK